MLCSHLNTCAKTVSRCALTCTQVYANIKNEQSTCVSVMTIYACDFCLEIKHRCDYAMASIFKQSILPFSWISSGFELQPCTHLASHPTPLHYQRRTDTHTEPLKPCQDCACHQALWALATQLCCLKPSSLGLFLSADVRMHEAGLELKTLRTHDTARKSLCYVLYNLSSFYLSLSKLRRLALTTPV